MTTPTSASSSGEPSVGGYSARTLTAWALLALAALLVLFNVLRWIFPPNDISFTSRVGVEQFANTFVLVAPLLAMLVATKLGTALAGTRLMGLIALATYAVALVFGILAYLITIVDKLDPSGREGFFAFGYILQGLGDLIWELVLLALLALAALWTYSLHRAAGGKLPKITG
jgi:hypothetical protein